MEEGEATVPPGAQEEEQTLASGLIQANGHSPGNNEMVQNGSVEDHATAPQIHHKSPESKTQDARAEAFEKQYRALQQQLRQRDMAMMDLAEENEHLNKALTELKETSKEALVDRERLNEKIKRQQISLQSAESSLRKAQAEAVDARRESGEARRDANDARREATESSVALADAKAEVWAIQQAAKGKALGEDERRELEGALKALSASAQRASQEAGSWKENAQSWKGKVESLNQELDGKASALVLLENDLVLARQQVKDSEIRGQEASRLQSVAEIALQELRQESDRRARTFNSAVKAAVTKIQTDLETERDAALERIQTLQIDLESQAHSLKEENEALTTAKENLSAAKMTISQLEEDRQESKEQVSKLQEQVDFWQSAAQAAEEKGDAAQEVAEDLANKVAKLESHCEELRVTSDSAKHNTAVLEASFASDISRIKSALTSAQNEKQLIQITSSERMSKAMAEQIALRATISDLEGQLRAPRVQDSGKGSGEMSGYWLDNLGLERVNWKNKLRHQDIEKHAGKRTSKDGPSTSYDNTTSWSWSQPSNQDTSILRGRLSQRSIVMIIYIVVLHIIVMVSFTQRSQNCVDMVGQDSVRKLPGL